MNIMDSWALASLIVNVVFVVMLVPLMRRAPCWMQAVTVWLFFVGMLLFCVAYLTFAFDHWTAAYWLRLAAATEHLGVMVWIWRLTIQKEIKRMEEPEWKHSSVSSRPS